MDEIADDIGRDVEELVRREGIEGELEERGVKKRGGSNFTSLEPAS
jgi:hypothetical protein